MITRNQPQTANQKPQTNHANVAQSVEHIHGKDEVISSILIIGSEGSGKGQGAGGKGNKK